MAILSHMIVLNVWVSDDATEYEMDHMCDEIDAGIEAVEDRLIEKYPTKFDRLEFVI